MKQVWLGACTASLLALWAYPGRAQEALPPRMPAFDVTALDTTVDACENFYQYACGGWHAAHPMPPDVSFWSRPFTQFSRQVDEYVRALVVAAAERGGDRTPDEQKVGDYYAACMDTTAIEARGLGPLRPELALIDGMTSAAELPAVVGAVHRMLPYAENDGEPFVYLFTWGDPVEGGQAERLWIGPSGLGLPGRDYYLAADSASAALRTAYQAHLAQMLRLLGEPEADAARQAKAVLALENSLAAARLPNSVLRNDASSTSNPMTPDELQALTPHFRWADFFRAHGIPESERLNVMQPLYLRALDSLVSVVPLDTWKAYLRGQLVTERAKLLPAAFHQTRFAFYGQKLEGQSVQPPRTQACISHLERDLPQALSRVFVAQVFRPEMFEERAQCVTEQFSQFEYAPGIPVDGAYVMAEQVTELSSWGIAWEAYQNATAGQPQPKVAGFTPLQRYLLTNAQLWCTDATEGRWRALAAGGSSKAWAAPMVHGTVLNVPLFREAFACEAVQPMVKPPEQVCTVW